MSKNRKPQNALPNRMRGAPAVSQPLTPEQAIDNVGNALAAEHVRGFNQREIVVLIQSVQVLRQVVESRGVQKAKPCEPQPSSPES